MRMKWPDLLNHSRRRQTTSPADPRIEFERDHDRSVYSTPVKRLQDKPKCSRWRSTTPFAPA